MKICCTCKKKLPIDSFAVNRTKKDGRGTKCRECQRIYSKAHYTKNSENYIIRKRERHLKDPVLKKFTSLKHRLKKQGYVTDIDLIWYRDNHAKGCAVMGVTFDEINVRGPTVAQVDRILAGGEYVKNNCRLVCRFYNQAKSNNTDKETLAMMKRCVSGLKKLGV